MKKVFLYHYIGFVVMLVILVGGVLFGIRSYVKWGGNYYFGTIVEDRNPQFVVKGRKNIEHTFILTPDTVIKRGFHVVEDSLQVGDKVIMFGEESNNYIDVRLVRIMGHTDNIVQSQ